MLFGEGYGIAGVLDVWCKGTGVKKWLWWLGDGVVEVCVEWVR